MSGEPEDLKSSREDCNGDVPAATTANKDKDLRALQIQLLHLQVALNCEREKLRASEYQNQLLHLELSRAWRLIIEKGWTTSVQAESSSKTLQVADFTSVTYTEQYLQERRLIKCWSPAIVSQVNPLLSNHPQPVWIPPVDQVNPEQENIKINGIQNQTTYPWVPIPQQQNQGPIVQQSVCCARDPTPVNPEQKEFKSDEISNQPDNAWIPIPIPQQTGGPQVQQQPVQFQNDPTRVNVEQEKFKINLMQNQQPPANSWIPIPIPQQTGGLQVQQQPLWFRKVNAEQEALKTHPMQNQQAPANAWFPIPVPIPQQNGGPKVQQQQQQPVQLQKVPTQVNPEQEKFKSDGISNQPADAWIPIPMPQQNGGPNVQQQQPVQLQRDPTQMNPEQEKFKSDEIPNQSADAWIPIPIPTQNRGPNIQQQQPVQLQRVPTQVNPDEQQKFKSDEIPNQSADAWIPIPILQQNEGLNVQQKQQQHPVMVQNDSTQKNGDQEKNQQCPARVRPPFPSQKNKAPKAQQPQQPNTEYVQAAQNMGQETKSNGMQSAEISLHGNVSHVKSDQSKQITIFPSEQNPKVQQKVENVPPPHAQDKQNQEQQKPPNVWVQRLQERQKKSTANVEQNQQQNVKNQETAVQEKESTQTNVQKNQDSQVQDNSGHQATGTCHQQPVATDVPKLAKTWSPSPGGIPNQSRTNYQSLSPGGNVPNLTKTWPPLNSGENVSGNSKSAEMTKEQALKMKQQHTDFDLQMYYLCCSLDQLQNKIDENNVKTKQMDRQSEDLAKFLSDHRKKK